jgi:ubiquinone/menaquinone biosynthesis C-methylase UbiE
MGAEERFRGANIVDAGSLSPYWGEHAVRYFFALPLVDGRRVLDIACGTGYGMSLLNSRARLVVGVDASIEAVTEATEQASGSAGVMLADGLELPFADNSFDVITSFETLEHLGDRKGFVAELRRVLKLDGHLILSTPNANYTKPVNGTPKNPYHIFEYKPEELREELSAHFEIVSFLGQSLSERIRISPFQDAQRSLPKDPATQSMLLGWKVMNKLPLQMREVLSKAIWGTSFYPRESDYEFTEAKATEAPVLVVVAKTKR